MKKYINLRIKTEGKLPSINDIHRYIFYFDKMRNKLRKKLPSINGIHRYVFYFDKINWVVTFQHACTMYINNKNLFSDT